MYSQRYRRYHGILAVCYFKASNQKLLNIGDFMGTAILVNGKVKYCFLRRIENGGCIVESSCWRGGG